MTFAKLFWKARIAVAGSEPLCLCPAVARGGRGPGFLLVLALAIVVLCAFAASAQAEFLRVKASADAGLPQAQARQQALERALALAVYEEARRMVPAPVPQARLDALRAHFAPMAQGYVLTYQEVLAAKPQDGHAGGSSGSASPSGAGASASPAPHSLAAGALELELDVEANRPNLRLALARLGFFAGPPQPLEFVLRLGAGVTEKDAKGLESVNLLLGIAPGKADAGKPLPEASLERMPQGYYKAVLRQGAMALVADAASLPALWLDVWGKYFVETQRQAGPGMQRVRVAGFGGVDAALELLQAMTTWDEAVQEVKLAMLEMDGANIGAQYACRVINQQALEKRLGEALASRKLRLAGQAGQTAP